MSLIVIFCFLLVNRDNSSSSSSSSSLSSAQLSYYDGGKARVACRQYFSQIIVCKLSNDKTISFISGEFAVIVCKVSKCLIVYFPDDVCPRLPDPYNGRVHMTGIKSFFSQEISKTFIFFCVFHTIRENQKTL